MKVGILYICTGKYQAFFDNFYASCEEKFLPDCEKTYYVWTDSDDIKFIKENVVKIYQAKLGWPYDTMMRFKMFNARSEELLKNDYLYFFNANMIVNQEIGSEVIPKTAPFLVGALHPGLYGTYKNSLPYERNPQSKFYIALNDGEKYYQGCFNGGRAEEFVRMSLRLGKFTDEDLSNGIIPRVHDESALNWYFKYSPPLCLDSGYVYPECWNIPFEKKIIQLDKSIRGGHDNLRA